MGGFLQETEDLEEGAKRILKELTGLENVYMQQLQAFGKLNRDPVERTVSICFFALINIHAHHVELTHSLNGLWFNYHEKPDLIFDHSEMVELALNQLRYKAALHPIGFELLPEKFTIPQLQKLYEVIFDLDLDRRNFSRKIISTGLLIDTGEKNENSATKKATLYQLDSQKYKSSFNDFHNFISEFKW
jgi:ADP-ribose pyrophosphatase YjhB (NUDIX family)